MKRFSKYSMRRTNQFAWILLIGTLAFASADVWAQSDTSKSSLDSIFSSWSGDRPGGVACVVSNGVVVYENSFGLSDVRHRVPNSKILKYDLASNAKQFTAMCIALLEEQSKLSVEDDLRKYYPGLKLQDTILVKNLIDHTSGIRDAAVLAILSGKMNLKGEVRKRYDTKEYYLECLMRESDLNYPVGKEFAYNNFNYVLLGDIVEKVSGQSLSEFADSAIFQPLKMHNTVLRSKRGMEIENEAYGYTFNGKRYKRSDARGGIVGDHNVLSTVGDLVLWENNFLNNQLGNKSPELLKRVCSSSSLTDGSSTNYGYGLWISEFEEQVQYWHGGDDGRHTTILAHYPGSKLSVIVLSNSSRYDETQEFANQLARAFLGHAQKKRVENHDASTYITLSKSELSSRTGVYARIDERGLGHLIKVHMIDSSLFAAWHLNSDGWKISPVSRERFMLEKWSISFTFSESGGDTYLTERVDGGSVLEYRRLKPTANVLTNYVGAYLNESTGASIKVRQRKGKLIARKGILRLPMIAFDSDQFYAYENDALFVFKRNKAGQVDSFKVYAPDFRNFSFVRK